MDDGTRPAQNPAVARNQRCEPRIDTNLYEYCIGKLLLFLRDFASLRETILLARNAEKLSIIYGQILIPG